jgi:ATP-dependent helicase IRC3
MSATFFTRSGASPPSLSLRPYQQEILAAIRENYRDGIRRMVVSSATGTGKTVMFSQIPSLMRDMLADQILVLVHTEELVEQNAEELRVSNPDMRVSIEMAERHADPDADIIVASVPTLGRTNSKRRENFNWDHIAICICDEAHHATATTYRNIFEKGGFLAEDSDKLLIGFTATPNRADGTPLAEIFQKIVYDYPIRRGIEEKYLCDVTGVRVKTRTCLDTVHSINGEFKMQELADTVNTPVRNHLVAEAWLKEAAPRKTVAFTVDVQHAVDLASCFRSHDIAAEAVWGDDPKRAEKLARHKSGETLVLTNCAVLTEGYNDPSIACIVLAAPTKSALKFTQRIGRGTRLFEGKRNCLILDVVDATKKHSLASLASLLGFPAELELHGESAVKAVGIIEDAQREYPHVDLSKLTDLNKLKEYLEQVNLFEVQFAPEVIEHSVLNWFKVPDGYVISLMNIDRAVITQNLLGKFEAKVTLNGTEYSGTMDTLPSAFKRVEDTIREHSGEAAIKMASRNQQWHQDLATPKQLGLLRKVYPGKAVPSNLTKGAAAKLISQYFAKESPAATDGQMRYLKFLLSAGKIKSIPANCSKQDAGRLISAAKGGR